MILLLPLQGKQVNTHLPAGSPPVNTACSSSKVFISTVGLAGLSLCWRTLPSLQLAIASPFLGRAQSTEPGSSIESHVQRPVLASTAIWYATSLPSDSLDLKCPRVELQHLFMHALQLCGLSVVQDTEQAYCTALVLRVLLEENAACSCELSPVRT